MNFDEKHCSGCGACISICPKECISFITNDRGNIVPRIDEQLCIHCNLCKKTCPREHLTKKNKPLHCYAAYTKDNNKRLDSASGGIARIMYEKFLEKDNSYIVGVCWDREFNPIFKITRNKDDIRLFQGSKYAQAFPNRIYKDIGEKIKEGNRVLFIAMPCQIAGMKKYCEVKKIDTTYLILVDILCHGVSAAQYLKEEIDYYKDKWNINNICNISFRSNRKFSNFHLSISYTHKNKNKKFNRYFDEDPYFNSFLIASTLRESCYSCEYSCTQRTGDITIGDFIGLGKMPSSTAFIGNPINASMILCNTQKGIDFKNDIKEDLYIVERTFQEAYEGGASLQSPFPVSNLRNKFINKYKKGQFVQTIKKIEPIKYKIKKIKLAIIRIIKEFYMKFNNFNY